MSFALEIRIRLLHENRSVDLLALVDSGADDCMFPLEVAHELNLPLDPSNANRFGGIGTGHINSGVRGGNNGSGWRQIFTLRRVQ